MGTSIANLQYICNWKDVLMWKSVFPAIRTGTKVLLVILATVIIAVTTLALEPLLQKTISIGSQDLVTDFSLDFDFAR